MAKTRGELGVSCFQDCRPRLRRPCRLRTPSCPPRPAYSVATSPIAAMSAFSSPTTRLRLLTCLQLDLRGEVFSVESETIMNVPESLFLLSLLHLCYAEHLLRHAGLSRSLHRTARPHQRHRACRGRTDAIFADPSAFEADRRRSARRARVLCYSREGWEGRDGRHRCCSIDMGREGCVVDAEAHRRGVR